MTVVRRMLAVCAALAVAAATFLSGTSAVSAQSDHCTWLRANLPQLAWYPSFAFDSQADRIAQWQADLAAARAELAAACPVVQRRRAIQGALLVHPTPPTYESLAVSLTDFYTPVPRPAHPAYVQPQRTYTCGEPEVEYYRPGHGVVPIPSINDIVRYCPNKTFTVDNQAALDAYQAALTQYRTQLTAWENNQLDALAAIGAALHEQSLRRQRNAAKERAWNGTLQNDGTRTGGVIQAHNKALNDAIAAHWPHCRYVVERMPDNSLVYHRPPAGPDCDPGS